MTSIVLMIALCFHATFEGIATGLTETPSEMWTIMMGIAFHKWAEAASLGISF